MLGHRELTMQDYVGILKRRFWLILASAVLVTGLAVLISYVVPPQYMSQTLVIIEQQKVPENYVKPVVTEDRGERLTTMKQQILSRSRVEPIVERFNLFPGKRYTMDDRVELTRNAIGVNPIPSARANVPGFFISFKAKDARTAQPVGRPALEDGDQNFLARPRPVAGAQRSEEHTSELQSPCNIVCRLLLEKKNKYGDCCFPIAACTTYLYVIGISGCEVYFVLNSCTYLPDLLYNWSIFFFLMTRKPSSFPLFPSSTVFA